MIKNKLKISFLVAALSLAVVALPALADDLTFTNDTNLTIGGRGYTIQATSTGTSIVVDTNTLAVTAASGSALIFSSVAGDTLTNNLGLAQLCSGAGSSVTVIGPATVTFTPSSTTCTIPAGGGGLASGGGGGGGSTPPPVVTPPTTITITPVTNPTVFPVGCSSASGFSITTGLSCAATVTITTPVTTPVAIAGCNNGTNGFSIATGQSCANNGTVYTSTSTGPYNFGTVTLKNGSRGSAVMELQRFLNNKLNLGLVVDGILGPKTIAVIKKWQKDNGLVADGLIGPKTKAMMNSMAY